MGKLGNFAGAMLGGLVVLAGQRGVNYYNAHQTTRTETSAIKEAPIDESKKSPVLIHFDNHTVTFEDNFAPGMLAYLFFPGIRPLFPQSTSSIGAPVIELKKLNNSQNSAIFELPLNLEELTKGRQDDDFYIQAVDRNGNYSEKTLMYVVDQVVTDCYLP